MTVASASTHLSGGPIHAIHESSDSHAQDTKDSSESAQPDFAGAGVALASAVNSVVGAGKILGEFGRTFVPTVGLPQSGKSSGEFKPSGKGLNDEERRGAWVLAGIVGLGFLLGGGGGKDKKSLKDKASEAADKVKNAAGAGGVKGDEKWAKASGAEVVGHGTRKA